MDSSVTAAGAAGTAGGPRSKTFPIPPLKLVGDTVEAEIEGDMAAMELSDPVRRWVGLPNNCAALFPGWAGWEGWEEDAGGRGGAPAAAVVALVVAACPSGGTSPALAPPTVEGAAAKPVVANPVVSIALVAPAAPLVPAAAVASAAACPSSTGIRVGGAPWPPGLPAPPGPPAVRPEPSRVPIASAPTPRREAAGTPMGGDADSQPFPRCPPPAAPCEIPSTSLSAHESLLSPLLEWKETDFWRRGRLPPRRESAPENELVRLAEVIVVDERREKRRQRVTGRYGTKKLLRTPWQRDVAGRVG